MYERSIMHNETPLSNSGERSIIKAVLKQGGSHTAKELMEALGVTNLSSGNIRVRRIVLDLIIHESFPVVADHDGYRLARTPGDVDPYVEWLESHCESLENRIQAIKRAWDSYAKKHRPARVPRAPRKSNGVRKSKVRFPVSEKKQKTPKKRVAPTKKKR